MAWAVVSDGTSFAVSVSLGVKNVVVPCDSVAEACKWVSYLDKLGLSACWQVLIPD